MAFSGEVDALAVSVILCVLSSGPSSDALELSRLVVVAALGMSGTSAEFDSVLRLDDGVGGGEASSRSFELDESGRVSESSDTSVSIEDKLALAVIAGSKV